MHDFIWILLPDSFTLSAPYLRVTWDLSRERAAPRNIYEIEQVVFSAALQSREGGGHLGAGEEGGRRLRPIRLCSDVRRCGGDVTTGSRGTTKCPSPRNAASSRAGEVSAHHGGSHHPACLASHNLPSAAAASSRTHRSSGWEADEPRQLISSFAIFFLSPLRASKPRWLDLPAGRVALLPGTQANLLRINGRKSVFYNWVDQS